MEGWWKDHPRPAASTSSAKVFIICASQDCSPSAPSCCSPYSALSLRMLLPANAHLGICFPGNQYRHSLNPHNPTIHFPTPISTFFPNQILEEEPYSWSPCVLVAFHTPAVKATITVSVDTSTCFPAHPADTWLFLFISWAGGLTYLLNTAVPWAPLL